MIASLVARLRSRLNGVPPDTTTDTGPLWRKRFKAFQAEVREQKQRERQKRESLKAQSMRRARRIPSAETLRHMLRARTALAQRRAAQVHPRVVHPETVDLASTARCTTLDGLTWWVPVLPTQSAATFERVLLKQRLPYLALCQTREVAIGGVMLDIGANVGRMAIPRAILGDSTRVFCAEPDELNYQCLVANIRDNRLEGLIVADHVAVSDHIGSVALHRGAMSGSHRVVHAAPDGHGGSAVPSTTLDAWVERHAIDLAEVTFVKLDTQGSELHVLRGASRVLAQPHIAWQIEIAPSHLRLAGSDPRELYRILTGNFSHFYDMNPEADGPRLRPIGELSAALEYLDRFDDAQTDVVVYRAAY